MFLLGALSLLLLALKHPGPLIIVLGFGVIAVAAVAILLAGTRVEGRVRTEVISTVLVATAIFAFVALGLRNLSGHMAWLQLAVPAGFLVFLGGYLQFKTWNVRRYLSWLIPLAVGAAATLTPAVGYLSYAAYLEGLGLPYNALSFTTYEEVAAAAKPMALFVVLAVAIVGVAGLLSWLGGTVVNFVNVMVTLVCVVIFGSTLESAIHDADAAARVQHEGAPSSWYAVQPRRVCLSTPPVGTPMFGGAFDPHQPYQLLGKVADRWLVWKDRQAYWEIPIDSVSVRPIGSEVTRC